jgi:hypothetical protein
MQNEIGRMVALAAQKGPWNLRVDRLLNNDLALAAALSLRFFTAKCGTFPGCELTMLGGQWEHPPPVDGDVGFGAGESSIIRFRVTRE